MAGMKPDGKTAGEGTMTDEELKPLGQWTVGDDQKEPLSDAEMQDLWDFGIEELEEEQLGRTLVELRRLRAENQRLVERIKDHCEWLSARGHYPVAEELLRALEGGR